MLLDVVVIVQKSRIMDYGELILKEFDILLQRILLICMVGLLDLHRIFLLLDPQSTFFFFFNFLPSNEILIFSNL